MNMLSDLAQYARQAGLASRVGYKTKQAKWTIVISSQSKFVHLLEGDRTYDSAPHLEQGQLIAGGETRSHFLLDSLQVVAAMGEEKVQKKHTCFVEMLKKAGAHEPLLLVCARFLADPDQLILLREAVASQKAKPTDSATIRVGEQYVIALTTWHEWWEGYLAAIKAPPQDVNSMLCLMTGNEVEPNPTHPKISGLHVAGGQSSGTVLIGFDKDAFASYDLEQGMNAACSHQASTIYRDVLNHLIGQAAPPLAGSVYLHWYRKPIPRADDLLDFAAFDLPESDEHNAHLKARGLLESIHTGKRTDIGENQYYVLQVSAVGGRIMVRDWFSDSIRALATNITLWFDDLTLVNANGWGRAEGGKFRAFLMRLVSYRNNERISDTFARIDNELPSANRALWHSILRARSLPHIVASRALNHIRSRLLQEGDSANLDRMACALLKTWICREERQRGEITTMTPDLNTTHPSPAYHAGRMMAVLAALQQSALGDVGAGVVQRYYAAASTTPALVLGRLVKSAQFHLNKLDKGLAYWYEDKLATISVGMGTDLPATLSLEEQALFALGYYQQKASLNSRHGKRKSETEEDENGN